MEEQRALRIAASKESLGVGADTPLLIEAFRGLGWRAEELAWDRIGPGPGPVLVRHTWDYHQRLAAFLAWIEGLERAGTPLHNTAGHLRWNAHKGYLGELAAAGIPIPPTVFLPRAAPAPRPGDLARQLGTDRVVIKPAVAASAWRTRCVQLDDGSGLRSALADAAQDADVLIQAFMPEVRQGEWSLVYLGGAFSHAVVKTPAANEYRVQHEFGGEVHAAEPPRLAVRVAERVLAQVGPGLSFARVDGVPAGSNFILMELELIEPDLFLRLHPGAAEALARQVVDDR